MSGEAHFNTIVRSKDEIKIGPRFLTRYEKARIIGARALQLSMGAPILIHIPPTITDSIRIAQIELERGVLPIIIRRRDPSGRWQDIPIKILIQDP